MQQADPGGRGQHHRDEADRREQPDERRPPGHDQPEQQDGRQCKDEDCDRAQQDQAQGRVGRDHLRFEGRVPPPVVAERDEQAGRDGRHGQEEPEPTGAPDRRRESGEGQDRDHADQPHAAERAGHRDQPGLGREPASAQQPLEERRSRYLDGVARAVPHRGEIDHGEVDREGRGVDPGPAPLTGQHVLLDRGALGHRVDPLDVAPQRLVVDMPAGHDSPSASVPAGVPWPGTAAS